MPVDDGKGRRGRMENSRREENGRGAVPSRKPLSVWVKIGLVLAVLWFGVWVRAAYAANTCGGSDSDLEGYLKEFHHTEVTLLKVSQEGRVKAALYEREDLGLCTAIFQRRLLGLRWAYDGMNIAPETGLALTGSWNEGTFGLTKCEAVVFGDNRSGAVDAYTVTDAESVGRTDLEADYVLDVYVLDGAEQLPQDLVQYGPDGSVLEEER